MLSSHHGQFAGGNLRKLKELIMDEGCDGIYWFSDFQDRREASAIASFREDLEQKRVKLYIRSTERNPRDLIELSERTGGGFKNGIPESLSE